MNIEFTSTPQSSEIDFLTQKINQETSEFGSAYPFAFFIRNEVGEIIAGCNGSVVFGAVSIQINYGSAQIIVDLVWA